MEVSIFYYCAEQGSAVGILTDFHYRVLQRTEHLPSISGKDEPQGHFHSSPPLEIR